MTTVAPPPPRAPLSPARRWALGVGVVFSLALISYGVLMLVGLLGRTTEDRRSTLPATADRLVVTTDSGDLRVTAGDVEQVEIVARLRFGLREPELTQESGPGGVRLSASCGWLGFSCSVDYEVTVPRRFAVEADSSAGDVTVRGLRGDVRLHSSAGDLRGEDLRGSTVTAESSAGDIQLSFAEPPRDVQVDTSAGDVRVAVPDVLGGYRIATDTSAGDVSLRVGDSPDSARRVRIETSAGDVTVLPTSGA